jgi:3-methyladenine DNA glycosylase/8-oxoguanine DNA glycosylase
VCSYGYFILAPNRWDGAARALHRPLRGACDRLIDVTITQAGAGLRVAADRPLSEADKGPLRAQVARMLRLDEDFALWHRLHPQARRRKFDRLFRSPTLFEDIVKTITGCNVTWPNTMRMNALLCAQAGGGGFPTPAELAALTPPWLAEHCKVGYRAERIIRLARDVTTGKLDLARLQDPARPSAEVYQSLLAIHGIGPYAAGNIMQILGRYDRLAIDTETYRHFRQVHHLPTPRTHAGLRRLHRRIDRHYARYAPYQFLAYWFELWCGYESHAGDARVWDAAVVGRTFTAASLNRDAARHRRTHPEVMGMGATGRPSSGDPCAPDRRHGSAKTPARGTRLKRHSRHAPRAGPA